MSDIGTLKALAGYAKAFNQKWFEEESKALDSIPTFSAEQFIVAASPDAILSLIAEIERHQFLYDHMKAMREAYGYESWTEVLTVAEKLKADNASKNGQLKAFGKQVSTLSRTIRNRDRRLAKLEHKQ